jgi:PTM1-like, N-terminal domain
MYSKSAMGGSIDPYINVIFAPVQTDDLQMASLIIFSWDDVLDVGIPSDDGSLVIPPPTLLTR